MKTRLLWLDPACCSWIRHHALHSTEVAACQHGLDYRKSWLFVSNLSALESLASTCVHPPGAHVITSGRRSAQGTFLTRDTACYPASLCLNIFGPCFRLTSVKSLSYPGTAYCHQFCFVYFESPRGGWRGTCSSACWSAPSIVSAISDVPGLLASCPVTSSSLFGLAFLLGLSRLQSRTLT